MVVALISVPVPASETVCDSSQTVRLSAPVLAVTSGRTRSIPVSGTFERSVSVAGSNSVVAIPSSGDRSTRSWQIADVSVHSSGATATRG